MGSESHLCLSPMDPTTNQTPTPSFPGDGVFTNEFTNLSSDSPLGCENDDGVDFTNLSSVSPLGCENDDGVDFSQELGSKPNEAIDTENGSRSVENNQYSETEDVVSAKDLQTEPDSLDDDVETVIRNQHEYYFYCPCCGEDITKTVKLVKISDPQPTKNHDPEHKAIESETDNGSTYKHKKTKTPSWFPDFLQPLFPSVYGLIKDKEIQDEKGVDSKSPGTYNDLHIHGGKPSSDVSNEKDRQSFPKWNINVFVWLFLCIVIALSVLPTSPPTLIQPHLQLPSIPSLHLQLPSMLSLHLPLASVIWLFPMFAVLLLFIMSLRSRFSPEYHNQKGDKKTDSEPTYTTSEEPGKTQYQDDQAANPDQDFGQKTEKPSTQSVYKENQYDKAADHDQDQDKKKDNQKSHLTPIYPSPLKQPGLQPKIPESTEPQKDGSKIEILKSIVYGGLTESISSLCTVTSAAASGASTLNILALGVANLSSGLLLTVHSLQELINEKPRKRTDTDYSEGGQGEEEDRYEEVLGRREYSRLHKLIVISSFIIFGWIPPLVYGFSFRKRIEKKQEYKVLAVYAMSLLCVVLLSIAKAYVSKKRDYIKTLFRYTTMATTASGLSQFVGHLVRQWLEKSGFYDDSPVTQQI